MLLKFLIQNIDLSGYYFVDILKILIFFRKIICNRTVIIENTDETKFSEKQYLNRAFIDQIYYNHYFQHIPLNIYAMLKKIEDRGRNYNIY